MFPTRHTARKMMVSMLALLMLFSTFASAFALTSPNETETPPSQLWIIEQPQADAIASVGIRAALLEDFEQIQDIAVSSVRAVPGSVTLVPSSRPQPARHGLHSAKLSYDFTGTEGTSAAYMNFKDVSGAAGRPIDGYPKTIGLWVYGDGNDHWLRAQLQDASGAKPTVDFTASGGLNWNGWRYITANIPSNLTEPLRLNQIYLVETSDRNKNGGALYFDELRVFYGDTDVYELTLNGLTPMQVGETKRVNVLATYSGSKEPLDVTSDAQLASSDPAVARVNLDGSVTALKEGTAHIIARYRQASTAEYELAVGVEAPVIDKLDFYGLPNLPVGQTNQTEAFANYYGVPQPVKMLNGVVYDSSQANVASIDANGLVTAFQQSTTVVRAVYGSLSSTYELTIEPALPKLQRIELSGLHSMTVGDTLHGKVLATYENQTEPIEVSSGVAYKSGNTQVAVIDASGFITALKVGVSVITATYEGKSAAVTLVVNAETTAPKRQLRAAWIASVENIDWPKKGVVTTSEQKKDYVNLIDDLQASGMNAVVMQIKPTADAFYPSEYAPWSEWLTGVQGKDPGYDPLAFMIEETHKRNMEFHAWFNPYRVSMKADPSRLVEDHPARLHPDWVISYGGKLYFNPGIPEAKQFVTDSIMEVVRKYDIDAVHFDDYFYPYKVSGVEFPDGEAYRKYGAGFNDIADWRRDNVNSFIRRLSSEIKQVKPYVKFGISPFGVWRNKSTDPAGSDTAAGVQTYDDLFADTRLWIRERWIDYIAPQIYWSFGFTPAAFEKLVDWWSKEVTGTHTQLYIGHADYKINANDEPVWKNPDELPNQLKYILNYDAVKGSMHFSATSVLDNPLGLRDRLMQDSYRFQALVPAMPWLDAEAPAAPRWTAAHVTDKGIHLAWQDNKDSDAGYHVLYRTVGSSTPNVNDPSQIVLTLRKSGGPLLFTDTSAVTGETYTYAVTAVDRLHNESVPSDPIIVLNRAVVSIELSGAAEMKAGEQQSLQVIGINSSGNRIPLAAGVTFTSDNERVTQVDGSSGIVTAKQAGKAVITARYGPFLKASLDIEVASKVKQPRRIEIGKLKPMKAGTSATLQIAAYYADGTKQVVSSGVQWYSTDSKVAAIDRDSGKLRAIAKGKATIIAGYEGKTATERLVVTPFKHN